MKTRILSLLLIVVMAIGLLPAGTALAAATSGTCGDNLTWILSGTALTISGTGEMENYPNGDTPWGTDITTVTIKDGVTSIGMKAFYGCKGLSAIEIPDSVTQLGIFAFSRCSSLKKITVPGSIKYLSAGAFSSCEMLEEIIICEGVEELGEGFAHECNNLKSVVVPVTVTDFFVGRSNGTAKTNYWYQGTKEQAEEQNFERFMGGVWHYNCCVVHTYDNACDGTCNKCEYFYGVIHSYGAYVSDGNATTEKDGTKTRVCKICGNKETVTDEGSKLTKPSVVIKDSSKVFKDVEKKWYKNAVDYCYSNGFISGVSNNEFGVSTPVTRGMFVTILARIAGVDTGKNANNAATTKFTDVPVGKYYSAAVKWANTNGVVAGMSASTFEPNASITRQQLCVMIVNFAKQQKVSLPEKEAGINFGDNTSIAKWAKNAVAVCQKADIVNGYNEGSKTVFKPGNTATRAEAAQILYKFHQDYFA